MADTETVPLSVRLDYIEMKLDSIATELAMFTAMLERFRPILERYERASNANTVFGARRAMKGKE